MEKEAAVDALRDLGVCSAASWDRVLGLAPVARSRTLRALTPGFLARRPSFSSRASCPFVYKGKRAD